MGKIRTNKEVYTARNGTMCFVSREMIEFNQNKRKGLFLSVVKEQAFVEIEQDEIDPETGAPFVDENGDPTGQQETIRKIVQELGNTTHVVTYDQVNTLFTALDTPITTTEPFVDQYGTLQQMALLIDTQPEGLYNTAPEDWEIDA